MTKKLKFAAATVWILISRAYDAYCTNQFTPDLSQEANPLVSVLGLSWTGLLVVLGLLTVYTLYIFYISTFRPINLLPTEAGYTFSQIVAYTYLGRKAEWTAIFHKFPGSVERFNHWMGQTLAHCLVYAGIISTAMWLLINNSATYRAVHSAALIYTVIVLGCLLITYRWNRVMYTRYISSSELA